MKKTETNEMEDVKVDLNRLRVKALDELAAALDKIPFRRSHVLILVLVAFGALFDAVEQYNVGLASPLIAAQFSLSNASIGLLTTFTFGGMAVGALVAGMAGDKYGRKFTYMYNLALFTVGALIAALAPNFEMLLIGRLIVGLGLGGELNTGLTLVSELMPTKFRGAAVATVNVAAGGLGIFLSSAVAALMLGPFQDFLGGPTLAWRWLLGVLVLPAALVFVYRLILPESPRFLVVNGKIDETNQVLSRLAANKLRGKVAQQQFVGLPDGTRLPQQRVRLAEIFQGSLGRRTVAMWIVSAMTFGAAVTVAVFMPTVLVSRGFAVNESLMFTTIINFGGLIGAILASVFGFRFKRRAVLTYGAAVTVALSVGFAVSSNLVAILIFGGLLQMMFMLLNTTTWIWAPEIYPTRVRAFGTGAAVTVALLSASLIPYLAGVIFDSFGVVGMFTLVGIMYAVMALAVRLGPETQGLSLEQVSETRSL